MSVRQGYVAMQFSVTDACVGYTRNKVAFRTSFLHDSDFRCSWFLGTALPIIRRTVNEVKVHDEKLKAVLKFCYLGDMLCF